MMKIVFRQWLDGKLRRLGAGRKRHRRCAARQKIPAAAGLASIH